MDTAARIDGAELLLWPDGAPEGLGSHAVDRPAVTVHLPDPSVATGAYTLADAEAYETDITIEAAGPLALEPTSTMRLAATA